MAKFEHKTQPFTHQREAFEKNRDQPVHGVLWEQGTGKTWLSINEAAWLWHRREIDGALIVAPPGVHRNWQTDELPAHLNDDVMAVSRVMCWETRSSPTKWHAQSFEQLLRHEGLAWLLISYEGLMTQRGKQAVWRFLRRRRCLYVLDESHNIKTPAAKRTQSIVASGKYARYRRILTGTPVSQGPFDLYSQIRFLDPEFWKRRRLHPFSVYKHHFGVFYTRLQAKEDLGYDPGYDRLIEYRRLDELRELIKPFTTRVTKDQVLDLPPKLYSRRYTELSPAQRRVYEELRLTFTTELDSGSIVDASLAIVRLLRLQQILMGYVQTEAEEPVERLPGGCPRLELLEEIVDGLSHPAIIWCRFREDVNQVMQMAGSRAVRYDGTTSPDEALAARQAFQAGEAQLFVANTQKGKEGLTLTQARTVIYYSNSFRLLDRLQSEDRAHRIGQEHPVHYIDLIAPGTVDEHIVKALRAKRDIADTLTGDELRKWI